MVQYFMRDFPCIIQWTVIMLLDAFDNINENAIMQFEIEIKAKMSLIFLMMFKNDLIVFKIYPLYTTWKNK